jgi:hypothetical protein
MQRCDCSEFGCKMQAICGEAARGFDSPQQSAQTRIELHMI